MDYYLNLFRFYANLGRFESGFRFRVSGSYFREMLTHLEQKIIENNYRSSLSNLINILRDITKLKDIIGLVIIEDIDFYDDLLRLYSTLLKWEEDDQVKYNIAELTLEKDPHNQEALNTIQQLAEKGFGAASYLLGHMKIKSDYYLGIHYFIDAAKKKFIPAYGRLLRTYSVYDRTDEELLELLEERDEYAKIRKVFGFINIWDISEFHITRIVYDDTYSAEQIGRIFFLKKEYEVAEQFFQKILRKTNRSKVALSKLGDIYYQGLGRRQELEKAHEYYGRACDLKDQYACDKYREVNEKLILQKASGS